MSNFYQGEVVVNGRRYPGGEQAFHGEKFQLIARSETMPLSMQKGMLQHASKFQSVADPLMAKTMGGKGKKGYKLLPEQLSEWDQGGADRVQLEICRYKLRHDTIVRDVLIASGTRPLLHQDNRAKQNCVWGGRIDKDSGALIGNNKLGKAWVMMRNEIVIT